ncbi:MAG: dihydroneopterin aldolase [Balneolaceae bacterium]|nr:MAG: dihydroneopterin aldolase [Balneolaceae bacterium]
MKKKHTYSLDKLTIKALKFRGNHGYYENERLEGNDFELDVSAWGNFREAAQNRELTSTFNYEHVETVALNVLHGEPEKLIETLCMKIGDQLFEKSPRIKKLTVALRKLNPPINIPADYAEITMTWKR